MAKRAGAIVLCLATAAGLASAAPTAEIGSRLGLGAGVVGGYQDENNYIGGLGGTLEAEFALDKRASLGLSLTGGTNKVEGLLGGGGLDIKVGALDAGSLDLAVDAFGRAYYQYHAPGFSTYAYGGGAALFCTLSASFLRITAGGGASYDFFGTSYGDPIGALGFYGTLGLGFNLSKAVRLALVGEYGGDRFFLGSCLDIAISGSSAKAAKKPAPGPVKKPTPGSAKKK